MSEPSYSLTENDKREIAAFVIDLITPIILATIDNRIAERKFNVEGFMADLALKGLIVKTPFIP